MKVARIVAILLAATVAHIKVEIPKWGRLIEEAGIRFE